MSVHIEAKKGDIAETVLLPGDPMRAKWIAETFFENPVCYNDVRGMLGFTGHSSTWRRWSTQERSGKYSVRYMLRVDLCA